MRVAPALLKPTALTLDLAVAAVATITFARGGWFRWRLLLPFAVASIPCAFVGGAIRPPLPTYRLVLAAWELETNFAWIWDFDLDLDEAVAIALEEEAHEVVRFYQGRHGILFDTIDIPDVAHWRRSSDDAKLALLQQTQHARISELIPPLLRSSRLGKRKAAAITASAGTMRFAMLCRLPWEWERRRQVSRDLLEGNGG